MTNVLTPVDKRYHIWENKKIGNDLNNKKFAKKFWCGKVHPYLTLRKNPSGATVINNLS